LSTQTKRVGDDNDSATAANNNASEKATTAEVEGVKYKVVWSCLLLVEMLVTNLSCAAHFPSLSTNAVAKVCELLRLFNARATHLVLGAGAIHSAARLKSINAKHLSLVTQCLGMLLAIFPHVRAALMAQLPAKQHRLLKDLDQIKKDYTDHNEKVLNKFVTIIGGIVEHGLAPRIANTDFDDRARDATGDEVVCCVFLDGVVTNTRKMHQVLRSLLPPDHLQDVFSRIFAYLDQKVPALLISAACDGNNNNSGFNGTDQSAISSGFRFPEANQGKRQLLQEVESMINSLNSLPGVQPWDFTAITVLERKMDFKYVNKSEPPQAPAPTETVDTPEAADSAPLSAESEIVDSLEPEANGTTP
jgi:vacuolar protein sorting-associated protein 54